MVWTYIIWIVCLSFAAPSSNAKLQQRNIASEVSNELHHIANNDIFLLEEDPLNFSFDAVEPKAYKSKKVAVKLWFYTTKLFVKHSEQLNPLTLDLPPPLYSPVS